MKIIQTNQTEEIKLRFTDDVITMKNNVTGDYKEDGVTLRFVD